MRGALVSLIFLAITASPAAFAADLQGGEIKAPTQNSTSDWDRQNLTEAGFQYSSLNNGTPFGTAGLFHEFNNGFTAGLRGYVPLQYSKVAQAYLGELVARFMLVNETNQMYLEGTFTQGFFNDQLGTMPFLMGGANYGYMRRINSDFKLGASIGVDYANARITQDSFSTGSPIIYNKIALSGSYYF